MPGKTLALIPVRLTSKRLPRKHLREVNGRTLLAWLVERQVAAARTSKIIDQVVIATADEPESRELEPLALGLGVPVFFGDVRNVPRRFLQAAEAFDAKQVVIIDGDDVAASPAAVRAVAALLRAGFPRAHSTGLPFGMNASGFAVSVLRDALASYPATVLETGWGRIFSGVEALAIKFTDVDDEAASKLRFTLDYPEDLTFFENLLASAGDSFLTMSDEALVRLTLENQLYRHNEIVQQQYWINFNDEVAREAAGRV